MSRRAGPVTAVIAGCLLVACGGGSDEQTADTISSTTVSSVATDAGSAPSTSDTASRNTTPVTSVPPRVAETTTPSVPATTPTTPHAIAEVTDERGVEVVVTSAERIIPLDGDVAEIVFALGLGDQVVATDLSATYPPEADALPQIGYQRSLTVEPILEFDPTVLLATDIAGPPETIEALERVGVPLVIVPTDPTSEGPARKIVAVADALGVHPRGVELAEQVQAEIAAAVDAAPELAAPPRVIVLYVRGASTQLVLGRDFGIHWLIEAAGGVNVADEMGIVESAPISGEAILAAEPDVIIVPSSGLESVGGVDGLFEAAPALAETPAGQRSSVLDYDDQLMLGNGPRTGQFLSTLISDLAAATGGEVGAQPQGAS